MAGITPRERVLAAINRQEPDQVPLEVGGGSSTSMAVEGQENLKQYLALSGAAQEANKIFHVAPLGERVMLLLGSDCRPLGIGPPSRWKSPPPPEPGTFVDLWGIT